MKSLNRKIEKFCWTHPKFGVPRLMIFVVIGNILVWLFGMMDTTGTLYSLLYFDPALFCRGQVWRIVTFALVPETNGLLWFAISLYFYYFIGTRIEQVWGAGKFTIYYFSGLVLTVLYSLILYWITGLRVLVSATYVNLSLFFAFATLWPDEVFLLFFILPLKSKWLAWADAALFGISVIRLLLAGQFALAMVPVVAMLGYVLFCGEWLFDLLHPKNVRSKARTIQFKTAVRQAEQRQRNAPYTRKCSVCGRTDTDHPELEFRYCSRCQGYHCFCQDHISNHIHFTE